MLFHDRLVGRIPVILRGELAVDAHVEAEVRIPDRRSALRPHQTEIRPVSALAWTPASVAVT